MKNTILDIAVRYANSSNLIEMAINAQKTTTTLREDIDHIREIMCAGGIGTTDDISALESLTEQLKTTETVIRCCEKSARKDCIEIREKIKGMK